jgi:hypothetical protein
MEHSLYKLELWLICKMSCNQPIWAQISQTGFDVESFKYFKIRGESEKVAMMKHVPNQIYYHHEILRIFPQLLSIFLVRKTVFGFCFRIWKIWRVGPTCQWLCRHVVCPDCPSGVVSPCRCAHGHKSVDLRPRSPCAPVWKSPLLR